MIGQTENQQNAATMDSCFELVGSRQYGVAQQKVEQPTRASGIPNIHVVVISDGPVLTKANQLETAVHGCYILLILDLVSIMSLSC